MKRAALYLRRSTNKQDRSIKDQRTSCDREANSRGLDEYDTYQDDALSGTSAKGRSGFDRLMQDALSPNPPFRHIIVYDYSRLFRTDVDETCHYFHLLEKNGIEVISATENFPAGSMGLLFRIIKHWQAHEECIDISRKTLRGLESRASEGCWNGGHPPYGYDLRYFDKSGNPYMTVRFVPDGHGGMKREIHDSCGVLRRVLAKGERIPSSKGDPSFLALSSDDRVSTVVQIFEMYVNRGMGFKTIPEALNERAIPSPRGGRWCAGTVRAIITNDVYTGIALWNRSAQGKFHRLADGKAIARPKSEFDKHSWNDVKDRVTCDGAHPAIIDRETFEKAKQTLAERGDIHKVPSQPSGRGKHSRYLLTGRVICKRCNKHCHGHRTTKSKPKKDGTKVATEYYVCNSYTDGNRGMCPDSLYRREPLDRGVVKLVAKRVNAILSNGGMDGLQALVEREISAEVPDVGAEVAEVTSRLGEITDRIDTLLDSLTPINKEFVDKKLLELKEEKASLEARLSELQRIDDKEVDSHALAEQIMATVSRFEDLFPYGTIEEQKEFIGLFLDRVELDPASCIGEVYMKRFPMPVEDIGKSYGLVAGARYQPATSDGGPTPG